MAKDLFVGGRLPCPVAATVCELKWFLKGVITTAVGLTALWILPNFPDRTKMFNEEERRIALARLRNENEQGTEESEDQPFWPSFKRAFTVHSTLCIIGYSCINVSVAGLSTFMPTVIRTLGRYGTIEIQLRTVPPFVVAAVWCKASLNAGSNARAD
jgi:hypothetical protein